MPDLGRVVRGGVPLDGLWGAEQEAVLLATVDSYRLYRS